MKSQDIYNRWKEEKTQPEIKKDFGDKIMHQINRHEHKKDTPLFDLGKFIELISKHTLAKTAFIVGGAITGIVRLIIVVLMILNKGVING